MFGKTIKILVLPLICLLASCSMSPQQSFQNAKLTLINEIKKHFIGKEETLSNINYGEMQYILLNKTGSDDFPANRYYYTGKITLTLGDKKTRAINPTTYYDLSTRKGAIFDDSIKSFEALKKLIDLKDHRYEYSQGSFFPSNY